MPRQKQKIKARRGYKKAHISALLWPPFIAQEAFGDNPTDWPAMRACWLDYWDTILPIWIENCPGTRPYAWWCFAAPERRRRIDGKPHPFDRSGRKLPEGISPHELHYGMPRYLKTEDDFQAQYETEYDYLLRLKLMSQTEKQDALKSDGEASDKKVIIEKILMALGMHDEL